MSLIIERHVPTQDFELDKEKFKVTVSYRNQGDKYWTYITDQKDWTAVAAQVSQIFFDKNHPFDTAKVVFTGRFKEIETEAPTEKDLTFVKGKVTHNATETKYTAADIHAIQPKIDQKLTEIGKLFATLQPISSSPPPSTPAVVNAGGRCLDFSIAYAILKKKNRQNDEEQKKLADYLRTEAAKLMRTAVLSEIEKEEFFNVLISSIKATDKADDLINEAINAVQNKTATIEQEQQLRNFYANIIKEEPSGNMNQWLDSAFLYILPKIPVRREDGLDQYKVAVFSISGCIAKFPQDAALDESFIQVYYNGSNHYQVFNNELNMKK